MPRIGRDNFLAAGLMLAVTFISKPENIKVLVDDYINHVETCDNCKELMTKLEMHADFEQLRDLDEIREIQMGLYPVMDFLDYMIERMDSDPRFHAHEN